jgi:hypothetical protein
MQSGLGTRQASSKASASTHRSTASSACQVDEVSAPVLRSEVLRGDVSPPKLVVATLPTMNYERWQR